MILGVVICGHSYARVGFVGLRVRAEPGVWVWVLPQPSKILNTGNILGLKPKILGPKS